MPVKVLSVEIENQIEGFFVKINLKNKKRWLINCSYNRYRDNIANYISTISKSTDIYTSKYDNLFLRDFNVGIEDFHLKNFKYIWSYMYTCLKFILKSMGNKLTCFKNASSPSYINLILTNCPRLFQNSRVINTGLHKMVVTAMKAPIWKLQPKIIHYLN